MMPNNLCFAKHKYEPILCIYVTLVGASVSLSYFDHGDQMLPRIGTVRPLEVALHVFRIAHFVLQFFVTPKFATETKRESGFGVACFTQE